MGPTSKSPSPPIFDDRQSPSHPPSNSTPKTELQWVPLQSHPLFSSIISVSDFRAPTNLLAWDGDSRLYFWDSNKKCLHRISIRLGEPESDCILAGSPSKVLQPDVPLSSEVNKISININGSALFLTGGEGLRVMDLYGRSSREENAIICRTVSIGSEIYFASNNSIRILQISWHPYSNTHLGVLSSDSVFRIFDLSTAIREPEQEYYLQPSSSRNSAICPVDFSFGANHLWDKFSVFILFSDGSIYIICPVVPFVSVYIWDSIMELHTDAHTFGLKSSNSKAVSNSNLAISWLEAIFPELVHQTGDGGNLIAVRARPFALFDASVALQGPLRKVNSEDSKVHEEASKGRAVSFLYNLIGRDSILVTSWSGGQLQFDALADEIHPVWNMGSAPRLRVDPSDQILGVAMICESSVLNYNHPPSDTGWLGHPPPLLSLAIVDLDLPNKSGSSIALFADPLVPEKFFCLHNGGVDSVVLHFLPFTSGNENPAKPPSVNCVLSTCPGESSPLCGFLVLSDSSGVSWVVGISSCGECVIVQMENWSEMLTHVIYKEREELLLLEEKKEADIPTIISKELLSGPKAVLLPGSTPNLRSVSADSIEGRSMLHQYFKLFHENYVEYAQKVYFELQHHAPHSKKIIASQYSRLREAQKKLLEVERKQEKIENRLERAVQLHSSLEERLQNLRTLPGLHKKPLSKAEREFKLELDKFTGVGLEDVDNSKKIKGEADDSGKAIASTVVTVFESEIKQESFKGLKSEPSPSHSSSMPMARSELIKNYAKGYRSPFVSGPQGIEGTIFSRSDAAYDLSWLNFDQAIDFATSKSLQNLEGEELILEAKQRAIELVHLMNGFFLRDRATGSREVAEYQRGFTAGVNSMTERIQEINLAKLKVIKARELQLTTKEQRIAELENALKNSEDKLLVESEVLKAFQESNEALTSEKVKLNLDRETVSKTIEDLLQRNKELVEANAKVIADQPTMVENAKVSAIEEFKNSEAFKEILISSRRECLQNFRRSFMQLFDQL